MSLIDALKRSDFALCSSLLDADEPLKLLYERSSNHSISFAFLLERAPHSLLLKIVEISNRMSMVSVFAEKNQAGYLPLHWAAIRCNCVATISLIIRE